MVAPLVRKPPVVAPWPPVDPNKIPVNVRASDSLTDIASSKSMSLADLLKYNFQIDIRDRNWAFHVNWYLREKLRCKRLTAGGNYMFSGGETIYVRTASAAPAPAPALPAPTTRPVSEWTFEEKLEFVLRRSLDKLGPEVKEQVLSMLTPEAIGVVAGIVVVWGASHFFGVGEAIDIVLSVVGVATIGLAVFDGLDELLDFALTTEIATSESDLDEAADHFAKAVSILGIQAIMALLFRGRPKTHKGGRVNLGAPPPASGIRYKPVTIMDGSRPAGSGVTSWWGDITISSLGSAADRAIVLLHERVHQILTPKVNILRKFRCENKASSYARSSLRRYLEEALAETIAQIGVNGIRNLFIGITFPLERGYVSIIRSGSRSEPGWTGSGLIPEALSLVATGAQIAGLTFDIGLSDRPPAAQP